jgi:hypothetical protein
MLCGVRVFGVTICGVTPSCVTVCGVTVCGVTVCGVTVCGITLRGVTVCGATVCGATDCGVTWVLLLVSIMGSLSVFMRWVRGHANTFVLNTTNSEGVVLVLFDGCFTSRAAVFCRLATHDLEH